MIVVDTNIIAFLAIEGEWSGLARSLMATEPEWAIPTYWRYEMANVLSNYVRFKGMPLSVSRTIWDSSIGRVESHEVKVDPFDALEVSARFSITAYDACYVALAMRSEAICITGDRRLRKAVPAHVRLLDEIVRG